MNEKSQIIGVGIYVIFGFVLVFLIVLVGLFAPMGVQINNKLLLAQEDLINSSQSDISAIVDTNIKNQVNEVIGNGLEMEGEQIDLLLFFNQHAWKIVIGIVGIIVFLFTRNSVEFSSGGFV